MTPALTFSELCLSGAVFFVLEVAMVALMASYIQQIGASVEVALPFERAIAAGRHGADADVAVVARSDDSSVRANLAVVALAWIAAAALIRHDPAAVQARR